MPRPKPTDAPHVTLVYPDRPGLVTGNLVTAQRWAGILRELGCRVDLECDWSGQPCDALVALHAAKSGDAIERFHLRYPQRPLIVVGTGTDLYGHDGQAERIRVGFERASAILVLQPNALHALPESLRVKARVIYQSVDAPKLVRRLDPEHFDLLLLANMRPVKDPMLAARAARRLPTDSRVRIVHAGGSLEPGSEAEAQREAAGNGRYCFLGPLDRAAAFEQMSRTRVLLNTSRDEGGATTVSEGIALGLPLLATRIPGNTGLLGEDYPALFDVGDEAGLAALMLRAEREPAFLEALQRHMAQRAWITSRTLELSSWRGLLGLSPPPA